MLLGVRTLTHLFTLTLKTELSMHELAESLCSGRFDDATLVSCCGSVTLEFERDGLFSRDETIGNVMTELAGLGIEAELEP